MATNSAGVYQKDNGLWEYRFVMMAGGKQVNKKKYIDAFGNKLKTKREAIKAREAAMAAAANTCSIETYAAYLQENDERACSAHVLTHHSFDNAFLDLSAYIF